MKSNKILVLDSYQATMIRKPKFNGFQTGHGPHGKRGYNRLAEKRKFEKELSL